MLDPITLAGKILGTIDSARKLYSERLKSKEAQQLAVYYWGMVLFELRRNIDQAQTMTQPSNSPADRELVHYGLFTTRSWESLSDALRKLAPMPRMFSMVDDVNDQFREVSSLLRAAVDAPEVVTPMGHKRGGEHQWKDVWVQIADLLPRATRVFNDLRSIVEGLGRSSFSSRDWQMQEAEILPDAVA